MERYTTRQCLQLSHCHQISQYLIKNLVYTTTALCKKGDKLCLSLFLFTPSELDPSTRQFLITFKKKSIWKIWNMLRVTESEKLSLEVCTNWILRSFSTCTDCMQFVLQKRQSVRKLLSHWPSESKGQRLGWRYLGPWIQNMPQSPSKDRAWLGVFTIQNKK